MIKDKEKLWNIKGDLRGNLKYYTEYNECYGKKCTVKNMSVHLYNWNMDSD